MAVTPLAADLPAARPARIVIANGNNSGAGGNGGVGFALVITHFV